MSKTHTDTTSADRHGGAIASAVRVVSALTLLSRLAGMARDLVTARVFGDGVLGSALRAAFAFPNLFVALFGEGALSATFLPEFVQLDRDDPRLAEELASLCLKILVLVTGSLTLVVEAVLLIIIWFAPDGSSREVSFKLMCVVLPTLPLICMSALLGVILQSRGRFGPSFAAPLILNLCQIAVALPFYLRPGSDRTFAAYLICGSAVVAGVAQIVWSLATLRKSLQWRRAGAEAYERARRVLTRSVPVVLGLGTLQINATLGMLLVMWPVWIGPTMFGFALTLDERSNSILSYTQTIYQFPLGVFSLSVSAAIYPLLARTARAPMEFTSVLRRGVRLSMFISLPAMFGLILTRHDLVYVLLSGGRAGFSPEGVARASSVLLGLAPGVWAHSLNLLLMRAFFARQDTSTPLRTAIAVMTFNLGLTLTLMWPLREAGFAWSTAVSTIAQTAVLIWFCRSRLSVRPLDRATLVAVVRIAAVAVFMAAAVAATLHFWPDVQTWSARALRLGACIAVGGAAYLGASIIARLPELRWLMARNAAPQTPE